MKDELKDILYKFGFFEYEVKGEKFNISIDCGDGWFDILYDLCKRISQLPEHEDVSVMQVKEKFGSLRVYTNATTKEIFDEIMIAENASQFICENCGRYSRVKKHSGWFYNICEGCEKQ